MQAGVDTDVIFARIPSNALDPKPSEAQQQSRHTPPATQETLPVVLEHRACQCKGATAALAAGAHEAHSGGNGHVSSTVNGGPNVPTVGQQASMPCPAAGGECPVLPQEASCPSSAAGPLCESAEEGEGKGGSSMEGAGLQWDLPEGVELDDCLMLWLGDEDAPALTQLMLTYSRRFPPPSLILEQPFSASSNHHNGLLCHGSVAMAHYIE